MRLPICKSYRATDMESISSVGSYMYTLLLFLTHYKQISPYLWRRFFFLCRFVNIYFHISNLYTILRVLIHHQMQINYDLSYQQHLRQLEKAWFRKVHRDQPQLGLVEILEIAKHNFIDMVRNCEEYDVELLEELG